MKLRLIAVTTLFLLTMPLALAGESPAPATTPADSAASTLRINVNTADALALTNLKGVGEKKALAIIAYRRKHGPFASLADLEEVPGIGPAIIERNRGRIAFR